MDTEHTQQAYNRIARLYDLHEWFQEKLFYARWRKKLWKQITGTKILEVGVGTGKNIKYHPPQADVVAFDFARSMLEKAVQRSNNQVDLLLADAEYQPFPDNYFDTVVATFVFCSVPDPILGLSEIKRVLKPQGTLWLLEHKRSRWEWLGKLMDIINPLSHQFTGVNINRRTIKNVQHAGLQVESVTELDPAGIFMLLQATYGQ